MRCFKRRKGVNASELARVEVGCEVKKEVDGARDGGGGEEGEGAISHISYAGGCFAWPRQYYYHIFHIMRHRVCLLFHVTSLAECNAF